MWKRYSILFLVISTHLVFFRCGAVDVEQERQRLLETDGEFSRTSVELGAVEAFYRFFADDAVQLPGGGHPVYGRESIYEVMSGQPEYTMTWEPEDADVSRSGDFGYTWGTFKIFIEGEDGRQGVGYGKYVNVWKKQGDGSWKVVLDIGNQSPPPEG